MKIESVLIFLLGFFSCAVLVYVFLYSGVAVSGFGILDLGTESSPSDWVGEDDIIVLGDRIVLRVENASVSGYVDSGSMKPLFGVGANGIRVVPASENDVGVGDIISFRFGGWLVVHRVIKKGIDEDGVYFVTRGDSSFFEDGKVRFDEIEYVTIGVIW